MIRYGDKLIIGVDLGNFNMKTSLVHFPSALSELSGDGSQFAHELKVEKRYFALGGNRVEQRDDKADSNDDYLYLTLFAIARELEANGLHQGSFDIYLGVTLPPAYMKNKAMRINMKQFFRKQFAFHYNGRFYKINIVKVFPCPQSVAALYGNVLTEEMKKVLDALPNDQKENYKKTACPIDILVKEPIAILVDIGGGTASPVILNFGIPQPFDDDQPAKGVIFTYNRIIGHIKSKYGNDITEAAINMLLSGENIRISVPEADEIHSQMERYSKQLFMQFQEKKLPFSTAYTLLLGGGVEAVRNTWTSISKFAKLDFLTEIKATAIGCERMVERSLINSERSQESKVG